MIQVTMQEWLAITALRQLRGKGISPSSQDIARACGLRNRYQAYRLLKGLEYAGVVTFCGDMQAHGTMVLNYVQVGVSP